MNKPKVVQSTGRSLIGKPLRCVLLAVCLLWSFLAVAAEKASAPIQSLIPTRLEPIRFQLRWHHQFQFAGYYAAKEKGFYQQAGFDVTLVAGSPERQPVTEVLAGRAQYGEANSEVLLERLRGTPIVALAAIFQHSPSVLVTLKSSGIKQPADLVGKRVMSVGDDADAGFLAMFLAQKIDPKQVDMIPSSYQIQDLVDGKADAFNSYLTNEPFYLEERGIEYNLINPRDYGIDFYSDILFTTEQEVQRNPERAARFKQATIQGWNYALAHPEEIIQIIRSKYNSKKSLNHMRFEALSVQELIMPQFVEVGYMNPQRFEQMANVFLQQSMVDNIDKLAGFVFTENKKMSDDVMSLLITICIFLVALFLVAMLLALFNHRLQNEVKERKGAEEKLKKLADTDPLTQLLNRRAFAQRYNEELARAQRYNDTFSIILIDLDFFKKVNDRYGHEAGDRVLASLAELLRNDKRETDSCGRFGGEEFILLLPKTPLEEATVYAYRLCESIRNNFVSLREGEEINVTASVGVVEWLPEEQDEATIIRADNLLYQAKSQGRDQVVVCTGDI
ncbi:GGDEF domain-containing protein [Oceanicoccus sp. KOV_DT_Chl]|uniref:GGDEF domain-containing protein n=1 Tax=Oceanicoccus sp. KOV_DT_Chl TaxID=1904639 RepID=UPI00135BBCF3|nr:GGDEF domain-containing protein [Oceanicoccus sp. KOV_DT_Chl]